MISRLPHLELLALAILETRPLHGYALRTEIARRTGGRFDPAPGTLYPLLRRLASRGLIRGGERGDRRRRSYELTAAGRRELGRMLARWAELVGAVTAAIGGR